MTRAANLALVVGGLAAAFAVLSRRTLSAAAPLNVDQVRGLAAQVIGDAGLRVDPARVVRIAWIESGFNPSAVRFEPGIGDASAGLMQTLVGTARWLWSDLGFRAAPKPTLDSLIRDPAASIYFGGAYLDYLGHYKGVERSEAWAVRSYNGGPGNVGNATDNYWTKYIRAKARFG